MTIAALTQMKNLPLNLFEVDGNSTVITFEKAALLYERRGNKKVRSAELGYRTRIVQLSNDRYGIQFYNAYVIRICEDGNFILSAGIELKEYTAEVINLYTPSTFTLDRGIWVNQHLEEYANYMTVDAEGKRVILLA